MTDGSVVAHPFKARLRQFYPCWATSLPAATPSVCAQCRGSSCVPASSLVATTSSPTLSQLLTGCVYLNGLSSRSLWWRFESCVVWRCHIWINWFMLPSPFAFVVTSRQIVIAYEFMVQRPLLWYTAVQYDLTRKSFIFRSLYNYR